MRIPVIALLVVSGGMIVAGGQSSIDAKMQVQLKRLFPSATAFSPKGGDPPDDGSGTAAFGQAGSGALSGVIRDQAALRVPGRRESPAPELTSCWIRPGEI